MDTAFIIIAILVFITTFFVIRKYQLQKDMLAPGVKFGQLVEVYVDGVKTIVYQRRNLDRTQSFYDMAGRFISFKKFSIVPLNIKEPLIGFKCIGEERTDPFVDYSNDKTIFDTDTVRSCAFEETTPVNKSLRDFGVKTPIPKSDTKPSIYFKE